MTKGVSNRVLLVIPKEEVEGLIAKYLFAGKRLRKSSLTADQVALQVLEV